MFRFTTAGESHGRGLVAVLEGIPAGLPLSAERVNAELKRRMGGYGRGARMKIEADQIEWLAGVRAGETLGSPIAMLVWNRDWEHWQDVMAPEADAGGSERRRQVTRPRPGHADLAGALKYDRQDARDILERASARETVARVACGAVCKVLLEQFGVEIGSHVVELGGVVARAPVPHLSTPDVRPGSVTNPGREPGVHRGLPRSLNEAAGATNRAGGTEGGMTTGEPLVARVAMKPISTLMAPLRTVDLKTGGPAQAQSERSDVTAVPAMGVIAEAMMALVLAQALLEKFGGDALSETKRNYEGYLAQVRARTPRGAAS